MYKKLIIPVLALAALSFSASYLPVTHAAQSLPSIIHGPDVSHISAYRVNASETIATSTASVVALNSAVISAPTNVKIDFERSIVTSQPAPPKPVEPVIPATADVASPAADNAAQPAADPVGPQGLTEQETAGLAPWQVTQLIAQKNYMATMLPVPFTTNPPAQAKSAEVLKIAKAHLGVPYVWGGTSPTDGWDCSGYVQWVFGQAGIKLPRVSQWVNGVKIDPKDAQPGDLVVQDNGTHVGIYIGNGRMYSALNPSVGTLEHSTNIMKADYYRILN